MHLWLTSCKIEDEPGVKLESITLGQTKQHHLHC